MQQQNQRSVPAQVPVDEGEGELHQHGRYEREEEREPLPDLVPGGAVRGAEVQRCRGLGREQRHRHKDGTGESHPHSADSAIRGGLRRAGSLGVRTSITFPPSGQTVSWRDRRTDGQVTRGRGGEEA